MESEEKIIQEIQKGAFEKFEEIYEKYFTKIYRFLLMKANGNISLAEDVCSETFLTAFEKITQKEYYSLNFQSWIYTIAYHKFIDFIKSIHEVPLTEWDEKTEENLIDLFEKKEKTKEIIAYLESMWEDKKDLFLLRVQDQLRYDEIGTILGKNPDACRQEFSRLLKKIIENFNH